MERTPTPPPSDGPRLPWYGVVAAVTAALLLIAAALALPGDGQVLHEAEDAARLESVAVANAEPKKSPGSTSTTSTTTTTTTTTTVVDPASELPPSSSTAPEQPVAPAGTPKAPRSKGSSPSSPAAPPAPAPTAPPATQPPAPPPPAPAPPAPTNQSGGWLVTVYYTVRESNYGGAHRAISGCPTDYCRRGEEVALGSYPSEFLDRVEMQGTGLLTSGPYAGQYLNWSSSVGSTGFWISPGPKSASGRDLVGRSSAASPSLPFGTRFTIVDCGRNAYGGRLDAAACNELRSATWTIIDRFEPWAAEGSHHLDLYLGVEAPGQIIERTSLYLSWADVTIAQL